MNNLVSIGISFYNDEKYLEQAIKSVLNQTYKNWELWLINDGSNDNSIKIAKTYLSSNVFLIDDGLNLGLSNRLNQISTLANGTYLCRMDADDIMHPERVEKQVAFLNSHTSVDICGTSSISIDTDNCIHGFRDGLHNDVEYKNLFFSNFFIHPTVMGKKSWFLKNKYRYFRSQDYELWLRSYVRGTFYNIKEPLLFYREVGIPQKRKFLQSNSEVRKIVKNYFKQYPLQVSLVVLKTYLSDIIIILANIFSLEKLLVKSRNFELNQSEIKKYSNILNNAVN